MFNSVSTLEVVGVCDSVTTTSMRWWKNPEKIVTQGNFKYILIRKWFMYI